MCQCMYGFTDCDNNFCIHAIVVCVQEWHSVCMYQGITGKSHNIIELIHETQHAYIIMFFEYEPQSLKSKQLIV